MIQKYDAQDFICPNKLSEKKLIRDLPLVTQLTQNSWNFSTRTRQDTYEDVTILNPKILGWNETIRLDIDFVKLGRKPKAGGTNA